MKLRHVGLRSLIGQSSVLLVPNMVLWKMNNHEHRSKQTYQSYTFQPLMSFWFYLILAMRFQSMGHRSPILRLYIRYVVSSFDEIKTHYYYYYLLLFIIIIISHLRTEVSASS